jgi:hypothetical protein
MPYPTVLCERACMAEPKLPPRPLPAGAYRFAPDPVSEKKMKTESRRPRLSLSFSRDLRRAQMHDMLPRWSSRQRSKRYTENPNESERGES